MLHPSIIVDDFFLDPDAVVDLASKIKYSNETMKGNRHKPGQRSEMLHENYPIFFNYVNTKILKTIYPNEDLEYTASTTFQKVSGKLYPDEGWIHKDPDELTAIIYLSKHKSCGTSLCKRISFEEKEVESLNTNKYFEKTLSVDSKYNRLFLFDSSHWHMSNSFVDKNVKTDRLTLISFLSSIRSKDKNLKHGLIESRKLD
tara:strand:+ start:130 stop:732 length:603 start_codon:yes stop_codon:yes gene_type:complete